MDCELVPPSEKELTRQRNELIAAYPGDDWAKKVIKMRPDQVTAVYLNLKSQNKVT